MTAHEFWRNRAGDVWAVELLDGVVARARGPLHWSEINPTLLRAGYEYSLEEGAALAEHPEDYEPLDEAAVFLVRSSVD
jgi:hypothetical protein